jgi:hypothetical protein
VSALGTPPDGVAPGGTCLRGWNQELVFLPGGPLSGTVASSAGADAALGADGGAVGAAFWTVSRMTTGGMGRDPGMLIRIRVVMVVSVFFSSGTAAAPGPSAAAP